MTTVDLRLGDCLDVLAAIADSSVDSVVTDPPYGIGFMGHEWDQPGDYAAVHANGEPGLDERVAPSKRRRQPAPATGAGHPRERALLGAATGQDNRTHSLRGGAMHAGRYDLSASANQRFQGWVEAWASELYRILKPGGHLVSFGGTRTYHRLAAGIEDAGFEIRDQLAWLFGSGFPKSLDVSKAIDSLDAADARLDRAFRSQAWIREHLTPARVNEITSTDMGHHLTTHPTQPFVPTPAMLDLLRPHLPKIPSWLEEIAHDREVQSENMQAREVVGTRSGSDSPGFSSEWHRGTGPEPKEWDVTLPHTERAAEWDGWGTGLKPGYEPIVLARKPLAGTVAANVLEHRTGALNVDGCRIEAQGRPLVGEVRDGETKQHNTYGVRAASSQALGTTDLGRWPANVIVDEDAGALIDEEVGDLPHAGGFPATRGADSDRQAYGAFGGTETVANPGPLDDGGGPSRFYYCAKVSAGERHAGLEPTLFTMDAPDRNDHPTVKPIDLMRWLVRLITPPGGTVVDPFLGSGTTGVAAVLEGFAFVGIEREEAYMAIAQARISHWSARAVEVAES